VEEDNIVTTWNTEHDYWNDLMIAHEVMDKASEELFETQAIYEDEIIPCTHFCSATLPPNYTFSHMCT
jgi:hypothetical protein